MYGARTAKHSSSPLGKIIEKLAFVASGILRTSKAPSEADDCSVIFMVDIGKWQKLSPT